jgi:MFS superfamily sulfate permease-like transporter
MNRDHLLRNCVLLTPVLALVVFVCVVAVGLTGGFLFGIAIGAAVAVAVFGDSHSTCSLPFSRRGE